MSEADNVEKFYPADAAKDADNVLEQAMGVYKDVLVLGYTPEGRMDIRATLSFSDMTQVLWLLETFKHRMLRGDFDA